MGKRWRIWWQHKRRMRCYPSHVIAIATAILIATVAIRGSEHVGDGLVADSKPCWDGPRNEPWRMVTFCERFIKLARSTKFFKDELGAVWVALACVAACLL